MADEEAAALLASLGLSGGGGGGGAKKKKKKPTGDKGAGAADGANAGEEEEGTATGATSEATAAPAASAPSEEGAGGDDEKADGAASGASKGKKKKGKAAAPVEAAPAAPAAAAASKPNAMARKALEQQERNRREKEEKERLEREQKEAEEAEARAEEERKRKEEEEKEEKRRRKEEKKARQIAEGKPVTKSEKEKARKLAEARARLLESGMVPSGQHKAAEEEEDGAEPSEKKEKKVKKEKKEKKKKKYEDDDGEGAAPKAEEEDEGPKGQAQPAVEEDDKDWDEEDDTTLISQLKSKKEDEKVVLSDAAGVKTSSASAPTSGESKKASSKESKSKPSKKEDKSSKSKKKSKKDDTDSDSYSDSEEENGDGKADLRARIESARRSRLARVDEARVQAIKRDELRSPICCVLGHVDTGKTKILDMLRKTNVQEGEAGGITQQIGATFFPAKNMQMVVDRLPAEKREPFAVPGLLVIDTPGHEAFSNLRSRGSGLADVAILVIDIMHGLEQQTLESIELLKKRKTAFVVALNKVDRLYDWKSIPGAPIQESYEKQKPRTQQEFEKRTKEVITQLMEQGLNAKLYWENDSPEDTVSLCPTSAITGEGSPDLINQIVRLSQTTKRSRIAWATELECTVLEVKKIEGLGTTIDVCLVNGSLKNDDTLVLASFTGPLVTQVRSLLTPQPMREMRVKGDYVQHAEIKGAMGIKITCQAELENVVAGTSVFKVTNADDVEELKDAVMKDVADNLKDIQTVERGVFVQCSTLGSLEGLMVHLRKENIPVAGVAVGPVRKKDVTRASAMLETKQGDPDLFEKEYASVLAFNIKVDSSARDLAEELGVKIFMDETIYNLTDQYIAYAKQMREERRKLAAGKAVFPCVLRIIPGCVFNNKNPLVIGVDVVRGCVVEGTPIVVPEKLVPDPDNEGQKIMLELGRVAGIEKDRVKVTKAVRGEKVCIKIQGSQKEAGVQVGRHFEENNNLVSKISRKSIDVLKTFFKEDIDALKEEGWPLIQTELKKTFNIK